MTNYNELTNNLEALKLEKMKEILSNIISNSVKNNVGLQDSLLELTKAEIDFRDERAKRINIVVSNFPYIRTINQFDFSYQPTINKNQILDLASLRFIEEKTNIVFIGSSGVGKTHLATALGIEAASQRISTYFINFALLMEKIKKATQENRLESVIKHYLKYTVLIIMRLDICQLIENLLTGFSSLLLLVMKRDQ